MAAEWTAGHRPTTLSMSPSVKGRYGFAVGTTRGAIWVQKEGGIVMHLVARRTGLMLSLGADAVLITMGR